MTREVLERNIRRYHLIMTHDLDSFNEQVNEMLSSGYTLFDGGVRLEWPNDIPLYRVEMALYAPERQVVADDRMDMPTTDRTIMEAAERNRLERLGNTRTPTQRGVFDEDGPVRPDEVPQTPFWTADSPDPWDEETEEGEDEGEMNDHQLNRLGAINNHREREPHNGPVPGFAIDGNRPFPAAPRGTLPSIGRPNEVLIRAARQVMEAERIQDMSNTVGMTVEDHQTEGPPF